LCKEMAIMNGGRILKQTTPSNATKELAGKIWAIHTSREELEAIESIWPVLSSTYVEDQKIQVRVHAASQPTEHFHLAEPELEDSYFIALKKDA
jgi:ABC-type multidrug transport system ATPase subunit